MADVIRIVKDIGEVISAVVDGTGEVFAIDDLDRRASTPMSYIQKVKKFKNYETWIFSYAQLLSTGVRVVNGVEKAKIVGTRATKDGVENAKVDCGYVLLSILNAYFEVTGRLCADFPNYPYREGSRKELLEPHEFIKAGIPIVIPEIGNMQKRWRPQVINIICKSVRNPLAHTSFTGKNVFLSLDHDELMVFVIPGKHRGRIVINYSRWYQHLDRHFRNFVSVLESDAQENPEIAGIQKRFDERFPFALVEE